MYSNDIILSVILDKRVVPDLVIAIEIADHANHFLFSHFAILLRWF